MSREDTCKSLLLKFYGLDSDCKEDKKLSTSKGIENFENFTDLDEPSEHLISTDETGNNQVSMDLNLILFDLFEHIIFFQNNVDYLDTINDETIETVLSKSPHILTIDDFLTENKEGNKISVELKK